MYAQQPQLPALTPQHSTFWFWPGVNEEGQRFFEGLFSRLGVEAQPYSITQEARQQYPMFIHPPGELPAYRIGSYELNPGRWLTYLERGAYSQLANELAASQQPQAPAQQSLAPTPTRDQAFNQFNQLFGWSTPQQRAQLLPLVESLYNYIQQRMAR